MTARVRMTEAAGPASWSWSEIARTVRERGVLVVEQVPASWRSEVAAEAGKHGLLVKVRQDGDLELRPRGDLGNPIAKAHTPPERPVPEARALSERPLPTEQFVVRVETEAERVYCEGTAWAWASFQANLAEHHALLAEQRAAFEAAAGDP